VLKAECEYVIAAAGYAIQCGEQAQVAKPEAQSPNPQAVPVRFISSKGRVIAQVPVPLPLDDMMMIPRVQAQGDTVKTISHRCFVLMWPRDGAIEYHEIVNERVD
jgi:hypothetical protein